MYNITHRWDWFLWLHYSFMFFQSAKHLCSVWNIILHIMWFEWKTVFFFFKDLTCSCSFVHNTQQDTAPCRISHGTLVCTCMTRLLGCTCRSHTGSTVHIVGPTVFRGTGSVLWTGHTASCCSCTGSHSSSRSNRDCTDTGPSLHHRWSWRCSSSCCCTGDPRCQGDTCIFPSLGHICPSGIDKHSHSLGPSGCGCKCTCQSSHHTGRWGNSYISLCSRVPKTVQGTLLTDSKMVRRGTFTQVSLNKLKSPQSW